MTKDVEFNYFKDTLPYRGVCLDINGDMLIDIKECLIIIFKGLFKYIYDAIDKTIQISVGVTTLLQEK